MAMIVFHVVLYGRDDQNYVNYGVIVVLGLIPSPSQNGTANHIPWSVSVLNVWDSSK